MLADVEEFWAIFSSQLFLDGGFYIEAYLLGPVRRLQQYCSLSFVAYCKSTVSGLRKMEPTFSCIVIRSSNPMKQTARELIECSGNPSADRPEDSERVWPDGC